MSKKGNVNRVRPKKEIDEDAMLHFNIEPLDNQHNSTRKRLKKLSDVNPHEQLIQPDLTQKLQEQQIQYQQFEVKDDQDLQNQQKFQQNKKAKGHQQLDKFLQKRINPESKINKQTKPKPQKIQMTLDQRFLVKKQKQSRRKNSDDLIVSDSDDLSDQVNKAEKSKLSVLQYKEFNGSIQNQSQLAEKAVKLSLTAASEKHSLIEQYPIMNNQVNKQLKLNKKSEQKGSQVKAKGKSKKKIEEKQERQGPLAGMVIVFTGQFQDYDRDQIIEICMQLGAECPKSLTRKCTLLIQGSVVKDSFHRKLSTPIAQTAKSKEAKERDIQIICHDKLDDFFIQKTGITLQDLLQKNKIKPNIIYTPQNTQMELIAQEKMIQPNKQKTSLLFAAEKQPTLKQQNNQNQFRSTSIKDDHQVIKLKKLNIAQPIPMEEQKYQKFHQQTSSRLWTEKYKPTKLDDVIGENSQINQVREWLEAWQDIHIKGNIRQVKEGKGGWGASGSINSRAALLSGDPGIGKTTTARLLAIQLNYAVSEFNASDIRNRSGVNLMESSSYNLDFSKNLQKSLIIMDEVDGMSAGDRGGITAIIQMIKNTKIPIICICNDRSCDKIRTLASHCLDIRFRKPQKGAVVRKLKQILHLQGGSGEDRALELLVQSFQNDMRQILNYLQLIFKTTSTHVTLNALTNRHQHAKDASVTINNFDAARRLLNRSQFDGMKIPQRSQCFFIDSDLVPLLIQQNILASNKKPKMNQHQFHTFVQGLEGLIIGDMLDRTIRKEQEWGLMPSYGFMTCVYSTQKISDSIGFPQFSAWLGKNSSQRKNRRLVRKLKNALFPVTLCSNFRSIKSHYSSILMYQLLSLLKEERMEESIFLMETYCITPAILSEHLSTLAYDQEKAYCLSSLSTQVKSKLTKMFNKRHEDAKLSRDQKTKKADLVHVKFDPLMELFEEENDAQADEQEEILEGKQKGDGKKGKKK